MTQFFAIFSLLFVFTIPAWATDCRKDSERFKTKGGGCLDAETGLVWGGSSKTEMPLVDAHNFCTASREGSYTDWRLPTAAEIPESEEAFEKFLEHILVRNAAQFYWTKKRADSETVKIYLPSSGEVKATYPDQYRAAALCVRKLVRGCVVEDDRFVSANGGCYDQQTRLTWSVEQKPMRHDLMLKHCERIVPPVGNAKGNVWRLPTTKELLSIADEYGFDKNLGLTKGTYWSSETTTYTKELPVQQEVGDYQHVRAIYNGTTVYTYQKLVQLSPGGARYLAIQESTEHRAYKPVYHPPVITRKNIPLNRETEYRVVCVK